MVTTSEISLGDDLLSVSSISVTDKADWSSLWHEYTEDSLSDIITESTWERITLRPHADPVYGLIFRTQKRALGLLHGVLYPTGTYWKRPFYVEDLYISPPARRALLRSHQHVERKAPDIFPLIQAAVQETVSLNHLLVDSVRFDTSRTNLVARNTYEHAGFAGEERLVYTLALTDS